MDANLDDYLVVRATSSGNSGFINDPVHHLLSKGFKQAIQADYRQPDGSEEKWPLPFMKQYGAQIVFMEYSKSHQITTDMQWRTERNYQLSGIALHVLSALEELGLDPEKNL